MLSRTAAAIIAVACAAAFLTGCSTTDTATAPAPVASVPALGSPSTAAEPSTAPQIPAAVEQDADPQLDELAEAEEGSTLGSPDAPLTPTLFVDLAAERPVLNQTIALPTGSVALITVHTKDAGRLGLDGVGGSSQNVKADDYAGVSFVVTKGINPAVIFTNDDGTVLTIVTVAGS